MEGGGFDFSGIAKQMLGTVPLWFFAWAIFKSWQNRSKEQKEMLEKRLVSFESHVSAIQKSIQESNQSFHEKLNRIEIKMASQGVDSLKEDIESLKKEGVKSEMKIDALFRIVESPKRRSDNE